MPTLEDDLNTFRIFRGFPPGDETPGEETQHAEEAPEGGAETPAEPEIDLRALAEKVVTLLRQELRLERERLARTRPW